MKYIFPIIISVLLIVLCIINYDLYNKSKKIAFIDAAYIFNNFNMKKELESDFKKNLEFKKNQLDSLFELVTTIKKTGDSQKIKLIENEYLYKKKIIIDDQERLKASFDNKIWTQLNQFVRDYGQENKIDLILGANGEGNIMHGDSSLNISQKIVEFANLKYSGK